MPYVNQQARGRLWSGVPACTPGELNFVITELISDYTERKGLSYEAINEVIGVLECAKQEFYARVARPYEDAKCKTNGDVYDERILTL